MLHGQFLIQRQIGVAIYGDVWLAVDTRDGNAPVAIKQVHLDLARRALTDNLPLDNPWTESRTLAVLAALGPHDNIVHTRHQFQQDDAWFAVMEFCDGGDLWQRLEQAPNRRLPEPQAMTVFAQIVRGVHLLHSNGIAHRDLSLENVMLRGGVCKICDFGLSTEVTRVCHESVGRAYYAAPEVVAGKCYDPRAADMWSLGSLLFVLLTGSPLMLTATEKEPVLRTLHELGVNGVLAAWGVSGLISLETVGLLDGMLQIDPRARFTIEIVELHLALQLP